MASGLDVSEACVFDERIFVIDSDPESRAFLTEQILRRGGYRVSAAARGEDGLADAIRAHQPDLIMLAYREWDQEVDVLLRAIEDVHAPLVLLTSGAEQTLPLEALRFGVRAVVTKPYDADDVLAAVERSMAEERLRLENEALTTHVLRANRQLEHRLKELDAIFQMGKSVSALAAMDTVLPRIVDAAVQITQAEQGSVFLLEAGRLRCRARKFSGGAAAIPMQEEAEEAVALSVAEDGRDVLLTADSDAEGQQGFMSAAYVPLKAGERVVGVLSVSNISDGTRHFTEHDTRLLNMLSDYLAVAIEYSAHYESLRDTQEVEAARIRGTFERFVPPSVVDRVLANPEQLELGGKRQEISVLFADIRGYTAWSEDNPPEKVMEMLNQYLSLAAELILGWEGTLDKFFGDGLMAFFNAPEPQQNHVHRATDAALGLLKAAEILNRRTGYNLTYSIGVHVGEAVVGYIGTERAMNYTAIGDTVNLAKRLQESANPGELVVEEAVVHRLGDIISVESVGEIRVKGRRQPARAYRVTALRALV